MKHATFQMTRFVQPNSEGLATVTRDWLPKIFAPLLSYNFRMVVAGCEDRPIGAFIGFELDSEILECDCARCKTTYRLRYTKDERDRLKEHRMTALRAIHDEHPKHSDKIQVA